MTIDSLTIRDRCPCEVYLWHRGLQIQKLGVIELILIYDIGIEIYSVIVFTSRSVSAGNVNEISLTNMLSRTFFCFVFDLFIASTTHST